MFIVPWPCAGAGVAPASASSTRSATRLEVSTLPAATAAGGRALSTQPGGARRPRPADARPPTAGASGSVSTRTAKKAADLVTASGQLRLPSTCVGAAGEVEPQRVAVDRRRAPASSTSASPSGPPSSTSSASVLAVGERRRSPPGCGARRSRGSRPSRRAAVARRGARPARPPARRRSGSRRAGRAGRRAARPGFASARRARAGPRRSARVGGITTPSSSSRGRVGAASRPASGRRCRRGGRGWRRSRSARRRRTAGEIRVTSGRWVPPA